MRFSRQRRRRTTTTANNDSNGANSSNYTEKKKKKGNARERRRNDDRGRRGGGVLEYANDAGNAGNDNSVARTRMSRTKKNTKKWTKTRLRVIVAGEEISPDDDDDDDYCDSAMNDCNSDMEENEDGESDEGESESESEEENDEDGGKTTTTTTTTTTTMTEFEKLDNLMQIAAASVSNDRNDEGDDDNDAESDDDDDDESDNDGDDQDDDDYDNNDDDAAAEANNNASGSGIISNAEEVVSEQQQQVHSFVKDGAQEEEAEEGNNHEYRTTCKEMKEPALTALTTMSNEEAPNANDNANENENEHDNGDGVLKTTIGNYYYGEKETGFDNDKDESLSVCRLEPANSVTMTSSSASFTNQQKVQSQQKHQQQEHQQQQQQEERHNLQVQLQTQHHPPTPNEEEEQSTSISPTPAPPQYHPSFNFNPSLNFNQSLKAALDTYHANHTLVKSTHNNNTLSYSTSNYPMPVPPPFLSHEEECTLKTALAFVLAKARVNGNGSSSKGRNNNNKENNGNSGSMVLGGSSLTRQNTFTTAVMTKKSRLVMAGNNRSLILSSRDDLGRRGPLQNYHHRPTTSSLVNTTTTQRMDNNASNGSSLSLLGGLLSPPLRHRVSPITPGSNRANNKHGNSNHNSLVLDRKLTHIRDVLKLAVSSMLPLYRGALELKEECARGQERILQKKSTKDDDNDTNAVLEGSEGADDPKDEVGNGNRDTQNNDANDDANLAAAAVDSPRGRKPCAVYDYEAAVQPCMATKNKNDTYTCTSSYNNVVEKNERATSTLDGLCEHAIRRLSGLIREEESRARNRNRGLLRRVGGGGGKVSRAAGSEATATTNADEGARIGDSAVEKGGTQDGEGRSEDADGSPTVVTEKSRESSATTLNGLPKPPQRGTNATTQKRSNGNANVVRDAVLRLVRDDLVGDAYLRGNNRRGTTTTTSNNGRHTRSSDDRERVERRIEGIMATCHVLHRLLFLDGGCVLGADIVGAIGTILKELYSNEYCGKTKTKVLIDDEIDGESSKSRSISKSASSSENDRPNLLSNSEETRRRNANNQGKEIHQVVSSRWGISSSASYIHDRHERRRQSVDNVLSQQRQQRWSSSSTSAIPSYRGAKRGHQNHNHNNVNQSPDETVDSDMPKKLPLPRVGDVLAVNLLRLLEGAAAIRLHHRQRRAPPSCSRGERERGYVLDKIASATATEVLTEIRCAIGTGSELMLPFGAEDAAAFYHNEKLGNGNGNGNGNGRGSNNSVVLLPGAKMMLRLHLFELMNKLSLYEQV